jgi:hypothetical protein
MACRMISGGMMSSVRDGLIPYPVVRRSARQPSRDNAVRASRCTTQNDVCFCLLNFGQDVRQTLELSMSAPEMLPILKTVCVRPSPVSYDAFAGGVAHLTF